MFARLDHVRQTERETLKFRLLALFVVTVVLYLRRDTAPIYPTAGLVVGYAVFTAVLRGLLLPRFTSVPLLYGMLVADLATALGALYLFGLNTILVALVPILIAYYAIYLGYWATLPAATLGAFGYIGVEYTLSKEIGDVVSIQVPFFYILAILAGYLAEQRFKEREEVLGLRQLLETEVKAKSLMETVKRLERGLDLDGLALDVVKNAQKMTGSSHAALCIVDSKKQMLICRACTLPALARDPRPAEPLSGDGPGARALAAGRPLLLGPGEAPPWLVGVPMAMAVACPIKREEDNLGVLYLLNETAREMDKEELGQLGFLCESAGQALRNAVLYSEAQSRSTRLLSDLEGAIEAMGKVRERQARPSRRVGPLFLDPSRERVLLNGHDLPLAEAEFSLLYVLAEHHGQPVDEATILREVWGKGFVPQGNVVNVTAHRLRRKLDATELGGKAIRTVRGKGYALALPQEAQP